MRYEFRFDSTPDVIHERLAPLRCLIEQGIPCILWGIDALSYAHNVLHAPSDQEILVPDTLLDAAALSLTQDEKYEITTEPCKDYVAKCLPHQGEFAFPRNIRLVNTSISAEDHLKFIAPRHILLLPQSYYGLDTQSSSRFQSLVPPLRLYPANKDILVPKYHTMLEGLVHFCIYPPTGHYYQYPRQEYLIRQLIDKRWQNRLQMEVAREILSEITTEDCAWYMHIKLLHAGPNDEEIDQYTHCKGLSRTRAQERALFGCTSSGCDKQLSLFGQRFGPQTIRHYSTMVRRSYEPLYHRTQTINPMYRIFSGAPTSFRGLSVLRRIIRR
ncbi:hypothetical protein BDN70DRAFT_872022 [Pholiota conissans]|uniref:Uncharacterized protein n=1 Tax=Pholiota conissans TaxID=109636 RepID=A0A9P6CY30_9AGAR|nr:hypothetical protein BDN70DRAFT_872022 [Pholiota conissans]